MIDKRCDCSYGCTTCVGIAAWVCNSDDKRLEMLCTRCKLSKHTTIARLYEEEDIPRLVALDEGVINDNETSKMYDTLLKIHGGMHTLLTLSLELPLHKDN